MLKLKSNFYMLYLYCKKGTDIIECYKKSCYLLNNALWLDKYAIFYIMEVHLR